MTKTFQQVASEWLNENYVRECGPLTDVSKLGKLAGQLEDKVQQECAKLPKGRYSMQRLFYYWRRGKLTADVLFRTVQPQGVFLPVKAKSATGMPSPVGA